MRRNARAFRARVIEHKKARTLAVGPNMTWCFEDRLTIQYQVQEMLRVERIFEAAGIEDELDSYNPLIPDGSNFKVTLLIEFADPAERRGALARLRGHGRPLLDRGRRLRAGVRDRRRGHGVRENDEKTSSVHFLRFELKPGMRERLAAGADLAVGVDHEAYRHATSPVPAQTRDALTADLA